MGYESFGYSFNVDEELFSSIQEAERSSKSPLQESKKILSSCILERIKDTLKEEVYDDFFDFNEEILIEYYDYVFEQ